MKPNSKHPALTPETKAFLDALAAQGGAPLYELTYEQARQVLIGAQSGEVKKPEAEVLDRILRVGPTGEIEVRVVRPKNVEGKLPLVFYSHGGGWVMGNKETHDRLIREIAVGANAVVVFGNFTNSPEAQYPVPLQQLFAALTYAVEHPDEFGIDADKVAVVGDSVGGNMSAALTLMAKAAGKPKINYQVLIYPVTDARFDNVSYTEFADGPWLTKKAMEWFWDAYAPDHAVRDEITVSPLRATLEALRGLPPALVITDQNDVLRDEGEAYAQKLSEAGVSVTSVRFNGTIHDFMLLNALADTEPARGATQLVCDTLHRVFA